MIKHDTAENYSVDSSMAISKNQNKKCCIKENLRIDYMSSDEMQNLGIHTASHDISWRPAQIDVCAYDEAKQVWVCQRENV